MENVGHVETAVFSLVLGLNLGVLDGLVLRGLVRIELHVAAAAKVHAAEVLQRLLKGVPVKPVLSLVPGLDPGAAVEQAIAAT